MKNVFNKKISRRKFIKASGASAAGLATAGLAGSSALAQSNLSFMTWGSFIPTNNPLLESLVSDWGGRNGINVDMTFANFGTLSDTLATAAATGAGPDVISMLYVRPHQFADSLVDVSDVAEEIAGNMGGWFDVARETCMVDGVWRAVPFFATSAAMVYRQDLFAAAGYDSFPGTYAELLEAGRTLKEAGTPLGFALGRAEGDGNAFIYSLLWSFGGRVWDDDSNLALDSQETRDALSYVQQLYDEAMDPGVLTWDDGANNRAFNAGEIAATNNSSSILWAARRNGLEFADSIDHAPFPAGPGGQLQLQQMASLGILDYVENVDEAKDLCRFLNSNDVWLPLGLDGIAFYYPMFKALEDNPAMPWNFDPKLSAFKGLPESGKMFGFSGTPTPISSEIAVNFIVLDMFSAVAAGEADIDEAIEFTVEAIEDLL